MKVMFTCWLDSASLDVTTKSKSSRETTSIIPTPPASWTERTRMRHHNYRNCKAEQNCWVEKGLQALGSFRCGKWARVFRLERRGMDFRSYWLRWRFLLQIIQVGLRFGLSLSRRQWGSRGYAFIINADICIWWIKYSGLWIYFDEFYNI